MAVQVGDRVGYSAHFLRSTGSDYDTSMRRGVVESQRDENFVSILWDDTPERAQLAHISNVARVGSVAFGDPSYKPR